MRQGSDSSSKMALVGTALNFGEKMKIYRRVMKFLIKTSNLFISRCCFADGGKKWTKVKNARAGRAKLLFLLLNMQICDVFVAVAVVEVPH